MKMGIAGPALVMVVLLLAVACVSAGPAGAPAPGPGSPTPAASAPKAAWQQQWDKAVAVAGQEGELVYYSTASAEVRIALAQKVQEKFGIRMDFISGRGPELSARLQKEYGGGIFVADVVNSGATTLTGLKELGLLASLEPALVLPEVTDPRVWVTGSPPFIDKDKTFLGMLAVYEQYVARNTDMVNEGEITSLRDVLNPKWKGKIALFDPTATGTGTSFVAFVVKSWGMDKTREFLLQLAKQDVAVTADKRLHAEWLAKGKYPIALAGNSEMVAEFIGLGMPIAISRIEEGGDVNTSVGAIALTAKPAHPNAALVFINWLLSKEGHGFYVNAIKLPGARVDAPTEGINKSVMVKPGDKFILADEEFFQLQRDVLPMTNSIFGLMMK